MQYATAKTVTVPLLLRRCLISVFPTSQPGVLQVEEAGERVEQTLGQAFKAVSDYSLLHDPPRSRPTLIFDPVNSAVWIKLVKGSQVKAAMLPIVLKTLLLKVPRKIYCRLQFKSHRHMPHKLCVCHDALYLVDTRHVLQGVEATGACAAGCKAGGGL